MPNEIRDIPLSDLVIGKDQVRTHVNSENLGELAASIAKVGLLEPIVVAEAEEPGKFEILTGQRRFLAHAQLDRSTIQCVILAVRPDEGLAKVISLTENLVREDLTLPEKIDACTSLYKKYGSIAAVAEVSGLREATVREYVKFDRLVPKLQELVTAGEVDLKNALRAQDAASTAAGVGEVDESEAELLAREMGEMSGVQAEKLKKQRQAHPDEPVASVIEQAKTGGKVTQVIVTLGQGVHLSLQTYAAAEGQTQDDAAGSLIEQALGDEGFLTVPEE